MIDLKNKIETSYPLLQISGNEKQKTLFFEIGKNEILPGNFYMLHYGTCQKPVSVSHYDGKIIGFTVQNRGKCSASMISAKSGEYFGLTGPLGNSFEIDGYKKILLIGGGIGTAPIFFLANHLDKLKIGFDVVFGSRSVKEIEYTFPMKEKIRYFTEDGSYGTRGFLTLGLDGLLDNNYDCTCICGPEKMLPSALNKIAGRSGRILISMERYMKCGLGLCGSCVIDGIGLRVCEEGPVFEHEVLKKSEEFTRYHRNEYGIREYF
jgi:dihydroorotate dehydrogenase electron transfer subunit